MPSRRTYFDIICDILRIALNGAKKTVIMNEAKISYRQLKQYLELLLSSHMLTLNGGTYYTTKKGVRFIKEYERLRRKLFA